MALKKSKIVKGVTADYWKIIDCDVRTGKVNLGLYANQQAAEERSNFLEKYSTLVEFPIEFSNPVEFAYNEIKKSRIEEVPIEDEMGEVTYSNEETNWFADAEDC